MNMASTFDAPYSRYEMNRLVRNILTRHGVDLESITISCTAGFVYLYGLLKKATKPDLRPTDVNVIFREIESVPMVRGIEANLENWIISGSEGAGDWSVVPTTHDLRPTASSGEPEDHRISDVEGISDVLEDIKKK